MKWYKLKNSVFHCPLCGTNLHELEYLPPLDGDWSADQETSDLLLKANQDFETDKSLDLVCPKGCFKVDYPLKAHHPIRGLREAPSDSWSLFWIK